MGVMARIVEEAVLVAGKLIANNWQMTGPLAQWKLACALAVEEAPVGY